MIKQLLEEVRGSDAGRGEPGPAQGDPHAARSRSSRRAWRPSWSTSWSGSRCRSPRTRCPSESELRIAQAQLVGWLEGLFHGIQTALFAQQMAARAQFEEMRRRALPPASARRPRRRGPRQPATPASRSGGPPGHAPASTSRRSHSRTGGRARCARSKRSSSSGRRRRPRGRHAPVTAASTSGCPPATAYAAAGPGEHRQVVGHVAERHARRRRRPRAGRANRASPLAFDTPAAEISSSAVVEEWVSSTRSPTTSRAAARNASGSIASCRASSLTAGPS